MDQTEQLMRYGGGGGTLINPVAALVMLAAIAAILGLQRGKVFLPLLVTCFFLPLSQQLVIAGLHFMMFRILVIVAWTRLVASGRVFSSGAGKFRFNRIDKTVILYAASGAVTFIVLWGAWGAVIDRLGFLFNVIGLYFLFRLLIESRQDSLLILRGLAVVCIILAACMANEKLTGRNLFSVFGGVPEITYIREGKLRAQGAFAHPILAGTFGATSLPLFVALRSYRNFRKIATAGIVSSVVVTLCSASSTPVMALAGGIAALCCWPLRRKMRLIRWTALGILVTLHMVMKAPVWALINRVDIVGGSSSSHRYELIDQSIRHFDEWWLVGTQRVSSWGFEMGDTSNQYVDIGVTGGILTLALFLAVISLAFRNVGLARKACAGDRTSEWHAWALGSALFANTVAFLGISYFDQIIVAWFALLAMIATAHILIVRPKTLSRPVDRTLGLQAEHAGSTL